jgi:hypothetical protein
MIKALSAFAIAAFMAAALTVLPGFAPIVKASAPKPVAAAAKGDRLPVRTARLSCDEQSWPNIDSRCLRRSNSDTAVRQVRVVTARRN